MIVPYAVKQGEKSMSKIIKKMSETVRLKIVYNGTKLSYSRQKIKFGRNILVTSYTIININTTKNRPEFAKRGADSVNGS